MASRGKLAPLLRALAEVEPGDAAEVPAAPRSYTVQEAIEMHEDPRPPKPGDKSPVAMLREMLNARC